MTELMRCSRCKCTILLEYFSINRKGEYYKTCDKCRNRYSCDKCDYTCSTNNHLKRHIKMVHDKIKDIQCNLCEYTCSTNSHLKQHIKQVHDKIKDFQ